MSQEPNQDSAFERLLDKGLQHLETRWEYYSLTATEKNFRGSSGIRRDVDHYRFRSDDPFFLSIGFAIWLGDYLDNRAGGFAVAGLIFVPVAIGTYYIVPPLVRSKIIHNMLQDETTQDENPRG